MPVWELRFSAVDDHANVVSISKDDLTSGRFRPDGKPKLWVDRPLVAFEDSSQRKKPRPPADVSAMFPGALVLSDRAEKALGPFFAMFGQLLELECPGVEIRYYYNVTNLVDCVDAERSEKSKVGRIISEVFIESRVPAEPAIFKDPATALSRIYVNDGGRRLIEEIVSQMRLTGIAVGKAGDRF